MSRLSSYVVAVPKLCDQLRVGGGIPKPLFRFNSLRADAAPFIEALRRFVELVYRPLGMWMPKWVLYDCAVIPGLVFGMSRDARDVAPQLRSALGFAADYAGPVPLSMLIAIPTLDRDHWLTYEIADVNQAMPDVHADDLRGRTLRSGVDLVRATGVTATAQWRSSELSVHAAFAPLDLLAAWVPAHDQPATAVFRYELGAREPTAPTRSVDVSDDSALEALQTEIEAGARVAITGPPTGSGDGQRVPVAVVESS